MYESVQIRQYSGGDRNVGEDVSVSRNEQQWQMNQAQMFANAAASSGFPSVQTFRPQNWFQKSGIHPLIRPS